MKLEIGSRLTPTLAYFIFHNILVSLLKLESNRCKVQKDLPFNHDDLLKRLEKYLTCRECLSVLRWSYCGPVLFRGLSECMSITCLMEV